VPEAWSLQGKGHQGAREDLLETTSWQLLLIANGVILEKGGGRELLLQAREQEIESLLLWSSEVKNKS